ncbi:WXG100 family type VII secretion target [Mycolicibacterium sp. 22603]|uniref:WXG100 family type VII secretion target n=1 Tax=Mycolicibacterium sp. 22603 TaxID=3453950 RepID=UPI003F8559C7
MSGSVEVITSELHVAADRLRASAQRLQDGLSSVDLETSNLLSSGWKGEAASAFGKYWDQWHNGAGQVVRALQTMSDALDEAGRVYAAQDEEAGRALGSAMQGGGTGSGGGGGSPAGGAAPAAASSTGGSTAAAGAGSGQAGGAGVSAPSLADSMNLGQVIQPLSQLGAIPAQMAGQLTAGLVQAGQIAAGAAQQAVQAGIEMAQQAEAADAAEKAAGEEAPDEEEKPEAQAPEGASAGAEPGPAAPELSDLGTSGPEPAPGRRL